MRALLFGGSGMIGQGVLRELLARPEVTEVLSVGRTPLEQKHPKLKELLRKNLFDWSDCEAQLTGIDAVFFCLGVSSSGMSEADYTKVTYELPLGVAKVLKKTSPGLTFCFISGASTDATEKGRVMWARVKGRAENALQQVGFKAVYCFRPGYIQPMDGIVSKTPSYRLMYKLTSPLYPLFKGITSQVTSTRQLGFAMVEVALKGFPKPVLSSADINSVK
ncbi:MAG: NAD-dependent epimerase/dehydratase family protein [Archangium sp.]|nr:NAD-dependent epimerase/dehydratase family protein [Archangium sp.]